MRSLALTPALVGLLLAMPISASAQPLAEGRENIQVVDPYAPHKGFPRLTTPQWVGSPGVEAVVILAIDDMRDPESYEPYLRPILDRLWLIDTRRPVSVMTNQVRPDHPRLQQWLKEGLSIEAHTICHPCPLLQKGDFAAAARSYHDSVDLLNTIPGNSPVAFRMPCCDSINSPSPRFYAEIFNKVSPRGHFLGIDSSVFNLFTPDDPALPRDLVLDDRGAERFRKYLPSRSYVNTIDNYPYPYVIGNRCWEFPCAVPSDWQGQYLRAPYHIWTLEDMKAAVDLTVVKQGVFNLVFHPGAWIKNEQVVELIDHAVKKHGKKVMFLNFREAQERLDQNLLGGRSLRAADGSDNRVRIVDLNGDGYMDVAGPITRIWNPASRSWTPGPAASAATIATAPHPPSPPAPEDGQAREPGLRLVDLDEDGHPDRVFSNDRGYGIFLFDPATKGWTRKVMAGKAGEPSGLPKLMKAGTNNGFFVHSRHFWWQNEDTAMLPDHVDRRSFNELLKDVPQRAKSPRAALRTMHLTPGFTIELAASEPLVKDPIAFDWSADGRLWVVEMGDYPLGLDGKGKPGGVVRVLEDQNGDGVYDTRTDFLESLPFPTGVMPWRKGVLIASAPDILYAEDRDGDGKADHREVLFTGFGQGNQQHRLNGFELGLDGWVYGANGDSGGTVRSLKTGKPVNIQGRDFRFRPDTGEFETESGQTQYGRHRDDWGNWFGNSNPTWGWHFVLAESDLRRNPFYASPDPRHTLEPDTRLYPISRTFARFNDPEAANHVTSANSPTPYRDDLFGPRSEGLWSLFVSEPVHNLVHRMVIHRGQPSILGVRAPGEEESEFLSSTDNWFRPTQLKTGPDGALWIADMYRAVIEHPEWIPADVQKTIDLRAGSEEGRIYRVFPVDRRPRPIPRLDRLDTAGLVAAMDSPGGWQRDTAQRLLMHATDPAAIAPLRALVRNSMWPQAQVQALWTLHLLGALDEDTAIVALGEKAHPHLIRNAIKVSEGLLKSSPRVADAVLRWNDLQFREVRLQIALSLGNWNDPRAGKALAHLARANHDDPWIRAAVLSSALPHVATLLVELFREGAEPPPQDVVEPLVAMAGSTLDRAGIDGIIRVLARPAGPGEAYAGWQFAAARALIEASSRSRHPIDVAREPALGRLIDAARFQARSDATPDAGRILAIGLLRFSASTRVEDRDLLAALLAPRYPVAVSQAAVTALGLSVAPECPELVLQGWKTYSPTLRGSVIDLLLSRQSWTECLLAAIEKKRIPAGEIVPAHRNGLMANRNPEIRKRSQAVFGEQARSRQAVIDAYGPVLAMKGDPSAGATVFRRACSPCHRLNDVGVEVGPNLGTIKEKSPEALLIAILDPNRAFESRYANFTVGTTDGRVMSGLIASETATTVTLRRQEEKEDVVLRKDIDEMTASGQSLMPEGLEKDLSPRDMADLIALLQNQGSPRKVFTGNNPQRVKPLADGTIVLRAIDAEIHGDRLVFEAKTYNLGYWMAANDHAVWTFDVSRPGVYDVSVEEACADASAGDVLEIDLAGQRIRHRVEGTGAWEKYIGRRVGEFTLPSGPCRLEARTPSAPHSALVDLRGIILRPRPVAGP